MVRINLPDAKHLPKCPYCGSGAYSINLMRKTARCDKCGRDITGDIVDLTNKKQ